MTDPDVIARIDEVIRERGPEYEHLVEQRRERQRMRKRVWRKQRQTPEHREHDRGRKREERELKTPEQRERERQREIKRDRKKLRSFMAVDGEGGGTDPLGRQNYFLMCAAGQSGQEYLCHRDGKPLSARDCLDFILSLPAERYSSASASDMMQPKYCAVSASASKGSGLYVEY
jgi:hypothetical protein